MAEWRPFNASGDPETCLWCGRKLKYKTRQEWRITDALPTGPQVRAEKPGDYEDGFFCNLRCGYQFAVRMATLGRRLTTAKT